MSLYAVRDPRIGSKLGWSASTRLAVRRRNLPFGGINRSGFGCDLGAHGMEEFVNRKLICTAGDPRSATGAPDTDTTEGMISERHTARVA